MPRDDAEHSRNYRIKNKAVIGERTKAKKLRDPRPFIFRAARYRASKAGIPFNLDVEDIIVPDVCPYLGIPLFLADGRASANSPALDRVVPALGYVKGNVQIISHRANLMKNDASFEELRTFAEAVLRLHITAKPQPRIS